MSRGFVFASISSIAVFFAGLKNLRNCCLVSRLVFLCKKSDKMKV